MTLDKKTLSSRIYEILRTDILSQKISLGEKLTLKALQERFGVSSTPIREALTRLSDDGLVQYYSNIGVNVIELTEEDLRELYQFMGDLDSLAILYAAACPDQEKIRKELENNIRQTQTRCGQESMTVREMQSWIRYSDRFHLIFYDYCGNRRLTQAAERQRSQLTIFSNCYETLPAPQTQISNAHLEIFEAYRAGDFRQAAERMRLHLKESLRFALESLSSM